jgi:hypothetical protein
MPELNPRVLNALKKTERDTLSHYFAGLLGRYVRKIFINN